MIFRFAKNDDCKFSSNAKQPTIHIYDSRNDAPALAVLTFHKHPVTQIKVCNNNNNKCIIIFLLIL